MQKIQSSINSQSANNQDSFQGKTISSLSQGPVSRTWPLPFNLIWKSIQEPTHQWNRWENETRVSVFCFASRKFEQEKQLRRTYSAQLGVIHFSRWVKISQQSEIWTKCALNDSQYRLKPQYWSNSNHFIIV